MNELTQTNKTPVWFKPTLLLGMLLFAFYASTHMVAAGDTWVALACGRHFANHGVDTVEPFSFNSHKAGPSDEQLVKFPEWTRGIIRTVHPTGWIDQNWLTHLLFYKLVTWFGKGDNYNYDALVYWKFAIYFITVLVVFFIGKVIGAGDTLSAMAACLGMVVGRTFYDIRPAGFSNLLVPVFVLILALAMYKNYRLIWLMVPLVVFWANVHGGYIYAFIMLVPFIGINLLLRLPRRWSLCIGFVGLWAVLYLMSHQFITNEYYVIVQKILPDYTPHEVSLLNNKLFGVWVFLAIVSVAMTISKKIPSGLFYAYHFGAGAIYFLSLFVRFLPAHPAISSQFDEIYSYFVSSSLLSFFFISIAGTLIISAMAFRPDVFMALPVKGIYHTIAASLVALVTMIIFNPFHLTNLTHTFEISISKHAESWRQVNEWKPAFNWMDPTTKTPNPVGDETAFGVLCILTISVIIVWLYTYFIISRQTQQRGHHKHKQKNVPQDIVSWPKMDIAMIVISLLTMYMSIRSRRFIAISGAVVTPFVAVMIRQVFTYASKRGSAFLAGFIVVIALIWMVFGNLIVSLSYLIIGKFTVASVTVGLKTDGVAVDWKTRLIITIFTLSIVTYLYLLHERTKFNLICHKIHLFIYRNIPVCLFLSVILMTWMFCWDNILIYFHNITHKTWVMNLSIEWQARTVVSIYFLFIIVKLYLYYQGIDRPANQYRKIPISLFTLGILILCASWGLKYKRIYLDPWPSDPYYNSVFMRMTASHLKPMDACQFIKMNKISGKVFNYWTEGGAVALGQEPDPKTGQIPLKLFMDGRAQAAYNHDKFRLWQAIYSGGPLAQQALLRDRSLSGKELQDIGQWIEEQLGEEVWVVLLPNSEGDKVFMKALNTTGTWKTAYLDNVQHLLVNVKTPQGQNLISRILQDQALFPNQYSKDLTTFQAIAENDYTARNKDLYPLAKDALGIFPFPIVASNLMKLWGATDQRKAVYDDLANYLTDFIQKRVFYKKQDGYQQRLITADLCTRFMQKEDPAEKEKYQAWSQEFREEAETLGRSQIW